ncbi:MAG: aminotransferase class V, partial [Piscirickettsiaceae bacterium]
SASASNVMFCLASLESVLSDMGANIKTGVALPAAQKVSFIK